MKYLIVVVFLLVQFQSSLAMAQQRMVMVYGIGKRTCGEWTSEKSIPNQYGANVIWITGFVSAAGVYVDKPFSPPSSVVALSSWIDNYCQQNPLDKVLAAVRILVIELQDRAN